MFKVILWALPVTTQALKKKAYNVHKYLRNSHNPVCQKLGLFLFN